MSTENNEFNEASVKVLLDSSKHEYDSEHNRITVIDSKTGVSLPIISAYFLALANMNDYKSIFNVKINTFFDALCPFIIFISYTAGLIMAGLAVMMMVKVIMTRNYSTIKPLDLYDEDYLKNKPIYISTKLITLYIGATKFNQSQNRYRVNCYRKGWLFTAISIAFYVIYIIVKNLL